ncbi:transglycosylase SLT domain-containing protein [Roseateles sp.]|uniref:lytic transglycosylase domain-containing protein n=1 Tax=Roseateles sp. TaxID=1971397 RepID=UPI003920BCC1
MSHTKHQTPLLKTALELRAAGSLFLRDVAQGVLLFSHNTLALVGLAVLAVAFVFGSQADLRMRLESAALGWLHARHEARAAAEGDVLSVTAEPDAISRATVLSPQELSKQQAAVALWLARRYQVAPEPVSRLVKEAWELGPRAKLDPALILAVMAIESRFNPFAQSSVGAQGLMQVMKRVHDDKFEVFGGSLATFDPVTNLRVGVQVLRDCIARAGSVEDGLRYYVGAANADEDSGYAARVLAELELLRGVIQGRAVSPNSPNKPREPSPPAAVPPGEVALNSR